MGAPHWEDMCYTRRLLNSNDFTPSAALADKLLMSVRQKSNPSKVIPSVSGAAINP